MCDEPTESRAGQAVRDDDLTLQWSTPLQGAEHRSGIPAARPDHDELWGALAPLPDQLAPDVQKQAMVLARLDRSTHDKIIVSAEVLIGLILFKEDRRNRE